MHGENRGMSLSISVLMNSPLLYSRANMIARLVMGWLESGRLCRDSLWHTILVEQFDSYNFSRESFWRRKGWGRTFGWLKNQMENFAG